MEPDRRILAIPAVADMANARETAWENSKALPFAQAKNGLPLTAADIDDAEARLARFAPFIERRFPETAPQHGLIESPLQEILRMRDRLNAQYGAALAGRLLLKRDDSLAVSGSVKARGGIYEVLKHAETLALEHGLLQGDYTVFDTPGARAFFRRWSVHVGSTGNLGLSIGIISAALGFRVTVHMSADARQWKKDLLRQRGAQVREYRDDYSAAVREGRREAEQDPDGYFVDDENSRDLFLGYAVAARRLKAQLQALDAYPDAERPLFVYLPCGVGGAPAGITFGLKQTFGDHVHCFFVEPVQAPCMLLGLASGLHNDICVQDIGLSGRTAADGLAVGRPSAFAGRAVEPLVSGGFTVRDSALFAYLQALEASEGIFIEPSACAAFQGPVRLRNMTHYLADKGLTAEKLRHAAHIVWATGGSMVPEAERALYRLSYPV